MNKIIKISTTLFFITLLTMGHNALAAPQNEKGTVTVATPQSTSGSVARPEEQLDAEIENFIERREDVVKQLITAYLAAKLFLPEEPELATTAISTLEDRIENIPGTGTEKKLAEMQKELDKQNMLIIGLAGDLIPEYLASMLENDVFRKLIILYLAMQMVVTSEPPAGWASCMASDILADIEKRIKNEPHTITDEKLAELRGELFAYCDRDLIPENLTLMLNDDF